MKSRLECRSGLGVFLLLVVSGSVLAAEGKSIPRSLYVPVAFRTCEHLAGATLFIGDQALGSLPTERMFVFTYYPHLKRLEPTITEVRIEGVRTEDGSQFIGRLAVDPMTISTAEERIDLDFDRVKQQLTYRIDVRYEKVSVVVRCEATCGHEDQPVPATALLDASPPPALIEEP